MEFPKIVFDNRVGSFNSFVLWNDDSAAAAISDATPSPRRSPRRRKNKRAPPPARQKKKTSPKKQKRKYRRHAQRRSDSDDGDDLERRLSDGVARRQAKSEQLRFLRKTLGSVIKLNMDEQILNGYFRQGSRFNKEKFEDHVRPIITSIMQGSEVDTDGLSAHVIFKLAVDIAKKRQSYKPRTPVSELQEKNERIVYSAENKARYAHKSGCSQNIQRTSVCRQG